MRLPLRANFAWAAAGNIAAALSQWAMLAVLARFSGATAAGQYALGLAIASPLFQLTGLALRTVQTTDVRPDYEFGEYFILRLGTTLAGLAVLGGALALTPYPLQTVGVVLTVGFAKACEAISDICLGKFQYQERMDRVAVSLTFRAGLLLGLVACVARSGGGALAASLALVVSNFVPLVAYDLRLTKPAVSLDCICRASSRRLSRLAFLAAPMGVVSMLVALNANIPRYFLAHMRSEADVGIFSVAAYLAVAANLLVMSLSQAVIPKLARRFHEGRIAAFCRLGSGLAAVAAGLGISGIALAAWKGPEMLELLYGRDFAGQRDLLLWLMGGCALTNLVSALGGMLSAARCFLVQLPMFLFVSVAIAYGCWSWIPAHGPAGAAMGHALGGVAQLMASVAILTVILLRARKRTSEPAFPPLTSQDLPRESVTASV